MKQIEVNMQIAFTQAAINALYRTDPNARPEYVANKATETAKLASDAIYAQIESEVEAANDAQA